MTKNELKEVQYFLENLDDPNPNEFLDSMGVIEAITTWLRNMHKEQGPKKLGVEFNEKL